MITKKLQEKSNFGKMKKNHSLVCVIPSRSQGDQINNLNFLYVGEKMLLEFTIISAIKSKIFDKIFVIFDNHNNQKFFQKKYQISGIVDKKKNIDFTKLIKKYNNKYFQPYDGLCVLFPNAPFKNEKTIRKMYLKFKEKNLNFFVSGCEINNNYYIKNNNFYKPVFKERNKKNSKLFYISGGINFFKKNFKGYDSYTNEMNLDNLYLLNSHEGFSIYTLYDLILSSTINDIDYSIIKNLLKKNK